MISLFPCIFAAIAFKKHFDVKVQGLAELQSQLDFATQRLAFFETGDPQYFATDLASTMETIKELEHKIAIIIGGTAPPCNLPQEQSQGWSEDSAYS